MYKLFSALSNKPIVSLESSNLEDITSTFSSVVTGRKRKIIKCDDSLRRNGTVKDENYIPYKPHDVHTELGWE